VNPFVESVLGEPAVSSLEQLPEVLGPDEQVDIVDVFRRAEYAGGIVGECGRLQLPALCCRRACSMRPRRHARCGPESSR